MQNPTPNLDWNLWIMAKAMKIVVVSVAVIVCAIAILNLVGCTYTRNAPLISAPLINANGNTTTVPLVGR